MGPSDSTVSDHALLCGIQNRDERALADLYDRYARLLFTLALRIVGDRAMAEEVLQDTFLRCWEAAAQYDVSRGRVAAWLMGVARNRAIDLLRSGPHQARLREGRPLATADPLSDLMAPDLGDALSQRQCVAAALRQLPEAQRQAIELAYYGGLTQSEISRVQAEPIGTVKTRMRAALDRLRRLLERAIDGTGDAGGA